MAPASTRWPAISSPARRYPAPAFSAATRANGSPPTPIPPPSRASPISTASISLPLPGRACCSACSAAPGPPAGPRRPARLLTNLAAPDGRSGTAATRPRLSSHRHPLRDSAAAAAPGRHYSARPVPARPHLRPLPAAPRALGPGTLARLLQHNWPGNVRELASVLETALLEADNGVILAGNLALPSEPEPQPNQHPPAAPTASRSTPSSAIMSSTCSTSTAATSSAPPANSPSAAPPSTASSATNPCSNRKRSPTSPDRPILPLAPYPCLANLLTRSPAASARKTSLPALISTSHE